MAETGWTIGLIGYGEVGRILAEDLGRRGAPVVAFDRKLDTNTNTNTSADTSAAPLREHAAAHGVRLAFSADALARAADLVISAVTASQAVAAATAAASAMRAGAWFLDLNSASPGAKIEASKAVEAAGGRYVEAAVMTSVPPYRSRVPMLLGGPHAAGFEPLLNALGFAATATSERLGVASATKMCRSIMIKGLEAMVIESYTTARAYGVEDRVIASLVETFPGIDWERQGAYFFQRAIRHGRRRAEEVREVAVTVREIGLEPWSAAGTAERHDRMADLADAGRFGDRAQPRDDWRPDADRILDAVRRRP